MTKLNTLGAIVLSLGMNLSSCCNHKNTNEVNSEIKIKVGSAERFGGVCIRYNGMSTENIFSISGCNEDRTLIEYHPKNIKKIDFYDKNIKVIEVSSEHIILGYYNRGCFNGIFTKRNKNE